MVVFVDRSSRRWITVLVLMHEYLYCAEVPFFQPCREMYHAWGQYEALALVKQTRLWGQTGSGMVRLAECTHKDRQPSKPKQIQLQLSVSSDFLFWMSLFQKYTHYKYILLQFKCLYTSKTTACSIVEWKIWLKLQPKLTHNLLFIYSLMFV